ncbi:OLC1v1000504C1 [Oldenlandia corymbosa var. corymbosa]|uniref:OLC1v1000504C1 n=1 Tax=Oldenlandia corymbosa var. corymbosa TaxID=529605 RepID=A0AAV1D3U9_OLDCO|nr:OLC1v1000504C1 [Oldenlandia corymbosa var. corymbosa]
MASSFNLHFLLAFSTILVLFLFGFETAGTVSAVNRAPFSQSATVLILPVLKDNTTSLHIVNIRKRTPLTSIPFVVDLNGRFLSVNCDKDYFSSTYNAPICRSTQCSLVGTHFCQKCSSSQARPGCHNNTCAIITTNPLNRQHVVGEIAQDVVAIQTLNYQASNPGRFVVLRRFLFACVPSSFLQGPLPKYVQGMAGFDHHPVSLPRQIASHFGFQPKFAMCLSSMNNQNGVIFFGNATYRITPENDFSQALRYTPLFIGSRGEYFIPVKAIRINRKQIQFNTTLHSKTMRTGGTMISTTSPYTALEHNIFQVVTQVFAKEFSAIGASQTNAVSPFGVCFNKLPPPVPKVTIGAPIIDFVMQNRDVTWSIYGSNSIIQARPGTWCLAFVNGGYNPRASIVLGAYQLEDHIVEFDLARSRFGFTETLLSKYTRCSQFNFNSTT